MATSDWTPVPYQALGRLLLFPLVTGCRLFPSVFISRLSYSRNCLHQACRAAGLHSVLVMLTPGCHVASD